jgi:SAM-dependent methyltransferase
MKWAMETLPIAADDSWGEDDNPRRYDAYAREYPGYRESSRDLIAVALPSADGGVADAAVLDLACGTGATTREILAVLGPDGRVSGVDKSAAMLGVAASSTTDPRATWIQARAESVDQHVTGPVDAVICNSAIWQTDFAATAMAVRAVMKAGGRFAFNVPAGFLGDSDSHGPRERYPSLLSEMRAIAERDYGWAPDDGAPGRARQRLTRESICRSLAVAGFDVEQVTEVSHHDSAGSQRAWLSIPVFTRDRLRGLPYDDRMRVLDKAYERLGPGQTERAQWAVFAARASDPGRHGHRDLGDSLDG